MRARDPRVPIWAIWAAVGTLAVVQVAIRAATDGIPRGPAGLAELAISWTIILALAIVATRLIAGLTRALSQERHQHRAVASEVGQLQISNEMLRIVAQSVDVPLAFQELARRIARLVPCDRVGLALLSEDGTEFQTYTARVHEQERRRRPRPEVVFKADATALGSVVRSREPLIITDMREGMPDLLDLNVLHTAGFKSAVIVPLVAKGRAVGTVNLVSRARRAFDQAHVDAVLPIAEMLAVAHVAQQLQVALGKHRLMEAITELTLSTSAEINSALQTIVGYCDLLERGYHNPELQRDLATIVFQAQRISGLLEKMRAAAHERLQQVAETVNQGGIPTSPEGFTAPDTRE